MTRCMVRPCVARDFRRSVGFGSRINVSGLILERVLRAIMDISARAFLLAARPQLGHSGHQGSHAPGRPSSISSQSLADLGGQTRISHLHHALFLLPLDFPSSTGGLSLVPTCAALTASCRGVVKAGCRPPEGLGLDDGERGARLRQVATRHRLSSSPRSHAPWPAQPRRCGRACWRARSPARCDAVASGRLRSSS